jgi:hypothetical protein
MSAQLTCPFKEAVAEGANKKLNFNICLQSCAWWDPSNNVCCVVSASRAIVGLYYKLGSADNK